MHIYIYRYTHVHMHIYIYIYILIPLPLPSPPTPRPLAGRSPHGANVASRPSPALWRAVIRWNSPLFSSSSYMCSACNC